MQTVSMKHCPANRATAYRWSMILKGVLGLALAVFAGSSSLRAEETFEKRIEKLGKLQKGFQTDLVAVRAEGKALLKDYTKPEEQGRIYQTMLYCAAQVGIPNPAPIIEICEAALKHPIPTYDRMSMYVFIGDHHLAGQWKDGRTLAERRRKAVAAYLLGLKELQPLNLPPFKPESPPVRPRALTRRDDSPEGKKLHEKALEQYHLTFQQHVLTGQVAYAYSIEPHATDELKQELVSKLKDPARTDDILARLDVMIHPEKAPKKEPPKSKDPKARRRSSKDSVAPPDVYDHYEDLANRAVPARNEHAAPNTPDQDKAQAELNRLAQENWPEFISNTGYYSTIPYRIPYRGIVRAIAQQGATVIPKVVIALREGKLHPEIAASVVKELPPQVQDTVIASIADPSPEVRTWVALCVHRSSTMAQSKKLEILKTLLQDQHSKVVLIALSLVQQIGPPAASLTSEVHKSLNSSSPEVEALALRVEAQLALNKAAGPSQEYLDRAANPKKAKIVREAALNALGNSTANEKSLKVLLDASSDSDASIRETALRSLSRLGPGVAPIAPRILARLKDEQPPPKDVQLLFNALSGVDPQPPGLEALAIKYCDSPDSQERYAGLTCLMWKIPPSEPAIQVALRKLQDPTDRIRHMSVTMLAPVAKRADVRKALDAALKTEKKPSIRQNIDRVLNPGRDPGMPGFTTDRAWRHLPALV